MKNDADRVVAAVQRRRTHAIVELVIGVALIAGGIAVAGMARTLVPYIAAFVPVAVGFIALVKGTLRIMAIEQGLAKPTNQTKTHGSLNLGFGFKSFVAWRYLMARDHRISRIVLSVLFFALFLVVVAFVAQRTIISTENPLKLERELMVQLASGILIAKVVGSVLLY